MYSFPEMIQLMLPMKKWMNLIGSWRILRVLLHGQAAREPTQGCLEGDPEGSHSEYCYTP